MDSEIMINGEWQTCEFLYPFNEKPIEISGPLGMVSYQRNRYNAQLVSKTVHPGQYKVRHHGKELVFEAERPTSNGILGNVL